MSQPSLKLTYFGGRGRAELSRLILAHTGLAYEDVRVEGKDWPALKPNTPWGQIPLLEVDGKTTIAQSGTVARFLARIGGIHGSNPLESAQIETLHDAAADVAVLIGKQRFGSDEDKKKAAEDNAKTNFPTWARLFERQLKNHNEGKGYFVKDSITYGDIAVFNVFSEVLGFDKDALKDFPTLHAFVDRVGKSEKIAAWIAKRPQTPF